MRRTAGLLAILTTALVVGVFGLWSDSTPWQRASADTYTIQRGDTLWDIANRLQIGMSVLLALNEEITSPNSIYVGQHIQVPDNVAVQQPTTPSTKPAVVGTKSGSSISGIGLTIVYLIQAGDTLSEIAEAHDTDTGTIISLNPGLNPNLLWIGDEIIVPSGSAPGTSQGSGQPQPTLNAGISSPQPGPDSTQTIEYVVQAGDGLWNIADSAGISLETLRAHNPQLVSDVLHPGQLVYVPVPDHRAPALDPSEAPGGLTDVYVVRLGDNASTIAASFGVSLQELSQLNGGINLSMIYEGQRLTVPWTGTAISAPPGTVPAVEVRRRTYVVETGDNFTSIAERHGLSLQELRAVNPLKANDLLVVGETLFLPGAIEPPIVAEERMLWDGDLVQYAAATLGVTPHTLLANHGWVEPGQWLDSGTSWRLPLREGLLVTVQRGDTLRAIANRYGVDINDILADPANGVDDPNAIVIGQEVIVPLAVPDFIWPAQGELTDPFGLCRSWDCSYRHKGLDIALDTYEPIAAAADGVVTFVGGDQWFGLGLYVEIDHGNGWLTVYGHLIEFAVWQGQTVSQGEVIGYNGNTGHSTGPHLHLEVQHNDWYVDPLVVLP